MSGLEDKRDELYRRLETGYERIETALTEGKDITVWEDFWVSLLNEYEKVCTELQRASEGQPTEQGYLFASETGRRWGN